MIRHTCILFLAWFISMGVLAQVDSPAATGAWLDTQLACSMEKTWDDKGSGADLDGYFYLPVTEPAYFIIGGYATRLKALGSTDCVLTVKDSAHLVAPVDWELIWKDKGSGARQDGSMWRAIPPDDQYRCLGSIPQSGYEKPILPNYRCVPASLTEKVVTSSLIWTDKGSGAKRPVTMFKLPHTGSFVTVRGRQGLIETYDLVMAPPETPSTEQEQAAPPVAATQAAAPGTAAAPPAEAPPVAAVQQPEPAGRRGSPVKLRRCAVRSWTATIWRCGYWA